MPSIELRSPNGTCFRIMSRDPETIRRWLLEHAEMAATNDVAWGSWQLQVYPLPDSTGAPDWPGGVPPVTTLDAKKFARLARWLRDIAGDD